MLKSNKFLFIVLTCFIIATGERYKRMAGGRPLRILKYRFAAAVVLIFSRHIEYRCVSTVIGYYWTITVAACTTAAQEIVEKQKESNLSAEILISGGDRIWKNNIQHEIDFIINHEDYSRYSLINDIALVKVKTPFIHEFEYRIPAAATKYFQIQPNSTAMLIGWGAKIDKEEPFDILLGAKLTIFDQQYCDSLWNKNIAIKLTENMICAGSYSGSADACDNDHGGPLVSHYGVLLGLVSWGGVCGLPGQATVFTKTSSYEKWILNVENRYKESTGLTFVDHEPF